VPVPVHEDVAVAGERLPAEEARVQEMHAVPRSSHGWMDRSLLPRAPPPASEQSGSGSTRAAALHPARRHDRRLLFLLAYAGCSCKSSVLFFSPIPLPPSLASSRVRVKCVMMLGGEARQGKVGSCCQQPGRRNRVEVDLGPPVSMRGGAGGRRAGHGRGPGWRIRGSHAHDSSTCCAPAFSAELSRCREQ